MKAHVGNIIESLRDKAGKSLEDLAYETGLSCSGILNIEKGKNSPNMDTLARIAEALGVAPSFIMGQIEGKRK